MSLIPAFDIGVWNAWLFMSVFLLQWAVVVLTRRGLSRRTGHPADMKKSEADRRIDMAAMITWVIAIIYSVFLPLHLGLHKKR